MRTLIGLALAGTVAAMAGCVPLRLSVRQDGVIACSGYYRAVCIYDPRTEKIERITLPGLENRTTLSAEWSPDGQKLLVVDMDSKGGEDDGRCMIVSADGKYIKEVARGALIAHWTPDGKGITLLGSKTGTLEIMDIETEKRETLLENVSLFYAWDPNGESLAAFQGISHGHQDFKAMTLVLVDRNKERRDLAVALVQGWPWLSWSKDGKQILFVAPEAQVKLPLARSQRDKSVSGKLQATNPFTESRLFVLDVASEEIRRLSNRKIGYADYSPDGKHILFVELAGNYETRVGVMNADGTGAKVLDAGASLRQGDTVVDPAWYQPVWLSNSRVQYYNSKAVEGDRMSGVWAIDIDGKNKEDLGAKIKKLVEALPEVQAEKKAAEEKEKKQ